MDNAVIYARVSQDEQAKGYSLPTQIEGCREFAGKRGYRVVAEFKEDYTGTALERPALDAIRALAQAGAFARLVVYELDRFARGLVKQILLEEEFERFGVTVEYVLAEYDDSPEGRLQKNVRAIVAEYEREKTLERGRRGKRGRAQQGSVNPGYCSAYGYKYVADRDKHRGTYVIVDVEAQIVTLIFTWYVQGDETGRRLGIVAIARKLTTMGVPTRLDGLRRSGRLTRVRKVAPRGTWNKSTVYQIIINEMYTGVWRYRDGNQTIEVSVPAIVPRDLWEAAQARRKHNTQDSSRNAHFEYLLRRRLRCDHCGRTMACIPPDRRRGDKSQYYRCDLQDRPDGTRCYHRIVAWKVDDLVWKKVAAIIRKPETILLSLQAQRDEHARELAVLRDRVDRATAHLADVEDKQKVLLDLYLGSEIAKELLDEKVAELKADAQRWRVERGNLATELAAMEAATPDPQAIQEYCEGIRDRIGRATFEQKRAILDALNVKARIAWDGDKPRVIITGYFPTGEFAFTSITRHEPKYVAFSLAVFVN